MRFFPTSTQRAWTLRPVTSVRNNRYTGRQKTIVTHAQKLTTERKQTGFIELITRRAGPRHYQKGLEYSS